MADINATDLTEETLATLDGQENVVLFDTAEGKKVSLQVLADYVVQKATESLMGSNQTVAAAFTALNSKLSNFQLVSSGSITANGNTTITVGSTGQVYLIVTKNNGMAICTGYGSAVRVQTISTGHASQFSFSSSEATKVVIGYSGTASDMVYALYRLL